MDEFTVKNVQYHPDTGKVAIHVIHKFLPGGFYLITNEEDFSTPGGGNWGNEEVLAVGQKLLDAHPVYGGGTAKLVLATKPAARPMKVAKTVG